MTSKSMSLQYQCASFDSRAWAIYGKKVDEIESLHSYKLHLEHRLRRLAQYVEKPPMPLSSHSLLMDLLKCIDKSIMSTKQFAEIFGWLMLATYLLAKKTHFTFSKWQ